MVLRRSGPSCALFTPREPIAPPLIFAFLLTAANVFAPAALADENTYPAQTRVVFDGNATTQARPTDELACTAFGDAIPAPATWCQVGTGNCGPTGTVGSVCGQLINARTVILPIRMRRTKHELR
jgi:hypothetical protein